MLSAEEFRRMALRMDGAVEGAHMGHPDFRANGRIFATIYPDGLSGMVKLTPDQQDVYLREDSGTFAAASGAWGRQGCTTVRLKSADETTVRDAMRLAWDNTLKKRGATSTKRKSRRP
jgi:hypothetical protein